MGFKKKKIFFTHNNWRGGFITSVQSALDELGCETYMCPLFRPNIPHRVLKKIPSRIIKNKLNSIYQTDYNKFVTNQLEKFKPDFLFTQNCGGLLPTTYQLIKKQMNIQTITTLADSPFNNNRSIYAISLRFNDFILNPEETWNKIVNNLANEAKVIKFFGGYEPDKFFPVDTNTISEIERESLSYDIIFTGNSYGNKPEGVYRAGVLGQLAQGNYNIGLYGDEGWKFWFKFFPSLSKCYKGDRLDYLTLLKLYRSSKIYINMPSPQISTSFQPRVFEIAASKGFQIIDYSKDLFDIFEEKRIVTFKNYNELKEKINYYLIHPDERQAIVEYMYEIVVDNFSFKNQIKNIAEKIGIL